MPLKTPMFNAKLISRAISWPWFECQKYCRLGPTMGISGDVTKLETMISIFWTLANTSNRKKNGSDFVKMFMFTAFCLRYLRTCKDVLCRSKSIKHFSQVFISLSIPFFCGFNQFGPDMFPNPNKPGFAGFHARDAGRNDEEHWGAERGHDGHETGYGAVSFHIPSNWTFVRFDWV